MKLCLRKAHSEYNILSEESLLKTKIFWLGSEYSLLIKFKNKFPEIEESGLAIMYIEGEFYRDVNTKNIIFSEAIQVEEPAVQNWEKFFVDYFFQNNVEAISINAGEQDFNIEAHTEHHYLSIQISSDKFTIEKLEFGRYLPASSREKPYHETSWTKGTFVNNQPYNLQFIQTSWVGENGKKFQIDYSQDTLDKVRNFLFIPFHSGWIELDYYLDEDQYYKAGGEVNLHGTIIGNTFPLLDIGEQDIPFLTDKLDQWLRVKSADRNKNNHRRTIVKTTVAPINTIL